jgi:hypothetical protein
LAEQRAAPIVAGAWLVAAIIAVLVAPGTARRLGRALAASEGISAGGDGVAAGEARDGGAG